MSKFSTPELETQAQEIVTNVLAELKKLGVSARRSEAETNSTAIIIADETFVTCTVQEARKSISTYGPRHPQGYLEVDFRGLFFSHRDPIRAKKFKAGKDVVARVVKDLKERYDALELYAARNKTEKQESAALDRSLKRLRKEFPEYESEIGVSYKKLEISFSCLTEDQARAILTALKEARIKL